MLKKSFQDAILARNVTVRYAAEVESMEFPDKEHLERYLKQHPKADRKHHTVAPGEHAHKSTKDLEKELEKELSEDPHGHGANSVRKELNRRLKVKNYEKGYKDPIPFEDPDPHKDRSRL